MTTLLTVEALTCRRGGRALFENLDLAVGAGDLVELTGPNGSGKTTLLRCLAGLYSDHDGRIDTGGERSVLVGHRAGLAGLLTPLENLTWRQGISGAPALSRGVHRSGPRRRHWRQGISGAPALSPQAALDRLGLGQLGGVRVHRLSAGQQRRVALARLLVVEARLWLLDEPFTALDDAATEHVRSVLGEHLRGGGAAVCATHRPLDLGGRRLRLGVPA